jgi:ABC-type phosphate/phosphonate transport system permease subunit
MGLVGAGGLAMKIHDSMDSNLYGEVLTEVALLMAIVFAVEAGSDALRRRFG